MKTLATALVAIQEISENLKAGIALENMNGEFFYLNDCWPMMYSGQNGINKRDNTGNLYFPDIINGMKAAESEILNKKTPVGYIITENPDRDNITHLILKFVINYTSGEPFCFCTLAKKIDSRDQLNSLIEKIKDLFQIGRDPELNIFSCSNLS